MRFHLEKQKLLRFLKYFVLGAMAIIILIIVVLEIGSRISNCPAPSKQDWPSCIVDYSLSDDSWAILSNLKEKRFNKQKITKTEYRESFTYLMIELTPEEMGPLNGMSCGSFGLVRKDLPGQAKLFVMRHELEHMLGSVYFMPPPDQKGFIQNEEFLANWAAFKEYPWGGIETVIFSLNKRNEKLSVCSIIGTWQTFKRYFLPFGKAVQ